MFDYFVSTYMEKRLSHFWDTRTSEERLSFILNHDELFWSLGLITQAELKMLYGTSETNRSYVLEREKIPFFASINLKQTLEEQVHYKKLKAALSAVFSKAEKDSEAFFKTSISPIRPVKA